MSVCIMYVRCDHFLFSIQDTGEDMLDDNCGQILEGAPTSNAYAPATDGVGVMLLCIYRDMTLPLRAESHVN